MIKSIKVKSSQTLLLLICFALLFFITACGGSKDDGTGGTSSKYSVTIISSTSSLAAGESFIIKAQVTGSIINEEEPYYGGGKVVKFSLPTNKSGATLVTLNGGIADATGNATAIYTAGSDNPNLDVEDIIQASITGSTDALKITRTSSSTSTTGLRMTLTADSTSLAAGNSTIVKATITDGLGSPAGGQAVAFTLLTNNSGATLTILGLGVTDASGQAQAIYKAGANSPNASVQDTVQASITGATGALIINRLSSSGTATGLIMTLTADSTSLSAGNSTIIKAIVTDGLGAPAIGQTVTFALLTNMSGATLVHLNGGVTDASGQAIANYTAGANKPTASVQDTIQASVTGTTGAVIITRTSGSGTSGLLLTLTAVSYSLAAGESTIITAKVTNGTSAVQGQSVTFSFVANSSHADLVILSGTTDITGEATALYTAGSFTAATVQDIVQASITGSTKAIIITKTGSSAGATASSIYLSASPPQVKSDGSTTSTITVTALNASNASISGIEVTMSSVGVDHGILSAPSVVTNSTTPATVTFSCGPNKANRTATVTGTSGSVSAQVPVQIVGSTVTVTAGTSSISAPTPATSTTLTVTLKDAGGTGISGQSANLTLTQSSIDGGSVTLGAISDIGSGKYTATVTGLTQGSVKITADYLGTPSTTNILVTATGNTFAITAPIPPAAMKLSETLTVIVNAPTSANVTFATTIGAFDDPLTIPVEASKVLTVAVIGGQAIANLTTSLIGIANIQVYDTAVPSTSDTLTVAMSSGAAPNKIILQASPTVVPIRVGTTTGSSTVTATVYDAANNPLANQPVMFEIVDGTSTSGGETVSPVVMMTAATPSGGLSVGQARTTFTSGSMPSSGTGVKIRASVVDTAVATGTPPSGNDAAIVIGGVAGSIAFGQDSKAAEDSTKANYVYKMSVLVADSNGNPVSGAVVNLGIWPVGWATGVGCTPDPNGYVWDPISETYVSGNGGTFWNEDANENLILDAGEDGTRCYYSDPTKATCVAGGKIDGLITPTNSVGGTVPASVTTDANGVAGFQVTYPKSSGMWIYDRVRATTIVQGSETRAEIILWLRVVVGEEAICAESPFKF